MNVWDWPVHARSMKSVRIPLIALSVTVFQISYGWITGLVKVGIFLLNSIRNVSSDKLFCLGDADCAKNGKCYQYLCFSNLGFEGDAKLQCFDINKCERPALNKCNTNANCSNLVGSFSCTCKNGYQGNGWDDCHRKMVFLKESKVINLKLFSCFQELWRIFLHPVCTLWIPMESDLC